MNDRPPATEVAEDRYRGLDTWQDEAILGALLEGQQRALASVEAAIPALSRAAVAAADRLEAGGRLVYLASGSPALMSLADALEIPQTYGIAYDRVVLVLSDGEGINKRLNGMREDDADGARADVAANGIGPKDCVIATSASGSTPYTVAGLAAAKAAGAVTIGIAGNAGAPLLATADIAVLSTLMGVRLNHVYDGLMVNVKADNEKLRGRSARIVTRITGVGDGPAREALNQSGGEVKPAILIAAGAQTLAQAEALLGQTKGNVRTALARLSGAKAPALN
jgi:N-acetylmuramic acid 6-phosphate etherase